MFARGALRAEMRKLDPFEPDLVNTSGGKLIFLLIQEYK
ncbi:hypothetical protein DOT_0074 [Desulfosporosinus sp. OT]|nr:hypothetical protein DOT_0074 [Desulfosporosinus sp. OT]